MSVNGVKFNDIHSYYDLNLILSQCIIGPAKPKENYIDVPGADGSLDLTEAHGDVKYNDRTGKLVFTVLPSDDFEQKKSEISNLLNGKHFDKITLDKDPDFYYRGRCSISDWKCDKRIGQITVDLRLYPYKFKQQETVVVCDKNYNSFVLMPYTLTNSKMPVIPTFIVVNHVEIHFGDVNTVLTEGTKQIPEFCLYEGDTEIKVMMPSTSSLTIKYQEGSL